MFFVCWLSFSIFLQQSVDSSGLCWKKLIPRGHAPPHRRDCAIGYDSKTDKVILYGGRSDSAVLSDTWILNYSNQSWHQVPNADDIPPGIYGGIYGNSNQGFSIGFGKGASAVINDVYTFDSNTKKWSLVAVKGEKPKHRYFTAGGIMGNRVFVSHGHGESELLSDTHVFNFASAKWQVYHDDINQYAPNLPHARYGQSGVVLPGYQFLMFGGCLSGEKSAGPCPSSDSWILDTATKKWRNLKSCASPRLHAAMALPPNARDNSTVAVLYGGKEDSKQIVTVKNEASGDEVAVFDSQTGEWKRKFTQKDANHGFPEMRFGHCMTTTKTGVAIFGGVSLRNGKLLNDIWILEGDANASRNSQTKEDCSSYISLITVHGILMFISWGVILQLAAFIARYFRHKENTWYNLHWALTAIGVGIAIFGFIIGVLSVKGTHFLFLHGGIGLDMTIVAIYQPIAAMFRPAAPEDGEKPKFWRRFWEISHKFTGRIALLLALANISLGLFLGLAPKSVWITWFCYMAIIIMAYVIAEVFARRKPREKKIPEQVEKVSLNKYFAPKYTKLDEKIEQSTR